VQHERLALNLGFSEPWLREVSSLKMKGSSELSETELLVQKLALAVVDRNGHETETELKEVTKAIGHKEAVAVLMLVGRYVMHALIANCLALKPPVSSPLDS
jgi:hypothetical protein